jgi:hypothetical protein
MGDSGAAGATIRIPIGIRDYRESGIETARALAPRDNLSRSGHTRDVLFSRARARGFDDPDYAGLWGWGWGKGNKTE